MRCTIVGCDARWMRIASRDAMRDEKSLKIASRDAMRNAMLFLQYMIVIMITFQSSRNRTRLHPFF